MKKKNKIFGAIACAALAFTLAIGIQTTKAANVIGNIQIPNLSFSTAYQNKINQQKIEEISKLNVEINKSQEAIKKVEKDVKQEATINAAEQTTETIPNQNPDNNKSNCNSGNDSINVGVIVGEQDCVMYNNSVLIDNESKVIINGVVVYPK